MLWVVALVSSVSVSAYSACECFGSQRCCLVSVRAYSACECFGSARWRLVCLLVLTLLCVPWVGALVSSVSVSAYSACA